MSTVAISSLDYSVLDDGAILAVQDLKGELLLVHSDKYSPLVNLKASSSQIKEHLTDPTLEPQFLRQGQLCFSRPSGRYLIQSGAVGAEGGQMTVWNAHIGAEVVPWITSKSWSMHQKPLCRITACAADSHGRILLVGGDDGQMAVICAQSGRLLSKPNDSQCRAPDRSKIECASCIMLSPMHQAPYANVFRYLGSFGTSTGMLLIVMFSVKINLLCLSQSSRNGVQSQLELVEFKQIWSMSFSLNLGSILCVATSKLLIAAGGEKAEAIVLRRPSDQGISEFQENLTDMGGSAVTSVAIRGKFTAFGSKDGCVRIFNLGRQSNMEHVTTIYGAANDWITSLAWGTLPGPFHPWNSFYIVVGSNDEQVRMYTTAGKNAFRLCETLRGPGGAITSTSVQGPFIAAGSSEGRIRLWSVSKTLISDTLTTLDPSTEKLEGGGQPGKLICAQLCYSALSASSHTENKLKPESNREDESDDSNIFARMDIEGLISNENPDYSSDEDVDMDADDDTSSVSSTTSDVSHPDEAMNDPTDIVSVGHRLQPDMHSFENIPKFTRGDVRSRGLRASELRLIVGQELAASVIGNDSGAQFRFRTYAPLVLEQRATLQGHLGLIANSLSSSVAHTDQDSECTLVSVARGQNSNIGCDVRLWQLPAYGTPKTVVPMKHSGPVTSVARFCKDNRTIWFVSGGTDGCLIFWRPDYSAPKPAVGTNLVASRVTWTPAFRVICSNVKITSILMCPAPTQLVDSICICFTVGCRVVVLCLNTPMLQTLESQGIVRWEQLKQMYDPSLHASSPRVITAELTLCKPPMSLSSCEQSRDAAFQFIMTDIDGQYWKINVYFSQNGASIYSPELMPNVWTVPFMSLGRFAFALNYPSAKLVNEMLKLLNGQDTGPRSLSKAALADGHIVQWIEPVFPITSVQSEPSGFLVVTELNEACMIQMFNTADKTFSDIWHVPPPFTVTALCTLITPQAEYFIVVATSDGFVRLFRYKQAGSPVCLQSGICPTGERITRLQSLDENTMQVIVGTQSGSVVVYEIV